MNAIVNDVSNWDSSIDLKDDHKYSCAYHRVSVASPKNEWRCRDAPLEKWFIYKLSSVYIHLSVGKYVEAINKLH